MPNTTNFGQNLPTPGADDATWGTENNDAHQRWDTEIALKASKSGDTFTGDISRSGAAATLREFFFRTAGLARWSLRANADAEAGSSAGSNLRIVRYNDAGTQAGTPVAIQRDTGDLSTERDVTVGRNLIMSANLPNYANDAAAGAGGVAVNQLYRNGSVVMIRVT